MNEAIVFYNLCKEGISHRMIRKAIESGITPDNIKSMNLVEFAEKYGVRKEELYHALKAFSNSDSEVQTLSIYALDYYGLSENLIKECMTGGMDTCLSAFLYTKDLFIQKTGIRDNSYDKIKKALDDAKLDDEFDVTSIYARKIIEEMEKMPEYKKALRDCVQDFLDACTYDQVPLFALNNMLAPCFKNSPYLQDVLEDLINENLIEINELGIQKHKYTIEEYLKRIPESDNKKLLIQYLNGSTLDEIGQKLGVTRERIRQRIRKIEIPEMEEDKYFPYYAKYAMGDELFMQVFDISLMQYRYVMFASPNNKGTLDFSEILNDETVGDDVKARVMKSDFKYVYYDGNRIFKNMTSILEFYLKEFVSDPTSKGDIVKGMKKFWEEITNEECTYADRAILHAIESSMHTVLNNQNLWRAFDVESADMEGFYERFDLESYNDVEISSKVLFNQYVQLMKEYDIRDEYELHNIMKKSGKYTDVDFGRVPMLTFGTMDRETQIKRLLTEMCPVSITDFVNAYCSEYGLSKTSFTSYVVTKFADYYHDGVLELNVDILPDCEIAAWKSILKNEYYTHEELKNIASSNDLTFSDALLYKANLSKIGFSSNESCIYSMKYDSSVAYFKSLIKEDLFDIKQLPRSITSSTLFFNILYDGMNNYEFIEYESGKYIRLSRLTAFNVTLGNLKSFCDKVYQMNRNGQIFTMKSVIDSGLDDELLNLGFDDLFLASILRSDKRFMFRRFSRTNEFLFKLDTPNYVLKLSKLLEQILFSYRRFNAYDLIDYVKDQYGIIIKDVWKLREFIKETDLYYDDISENVYFDYDTYYEEV